MGSQGTGDGRDPTSSRRLELAQRFMMSIADHRTAIASAELSDSARFHVPGTSPVAGTYAGRHEVTGQFQRVFDLTSAAEVVKWVDWMVGANFVSALVDVHLQSGLIQHQDQILFLFSFTPSGTIDVIRLFPEDQAFFDQFFAELEPGGRRSVTG